MVEKNSLNKFDKNIFLVKNLQVSKETAVNLEISRGLQNLVWGAHFGQALT